MKYPLNKPISLICDGGCAEYAECWQIELLPRQLWRGAFHHGGVFKCAAGHRVVRLLWLDKESGALEIGDPLGGEAPPFG